MLCKPSVEIAKQKQKVTKESHKTHALSMSEAGNSCGIILKESITAGGRKKPQLS